MSPQKKTAGSSSLLSMSHVAFEELSCLFLSWNKGNILWSLLRIFGAHVWRTCL